MYPAKLSLPIFLLAATAALLCITLLSGCPVAQVPRQASENSNTSHYQAYTPRSDDNRPPTDPVVAAAATNDADDNSDPDDYGSDSIGCAHIRFTAPAASVAVEPGATVEVRFRVKLDPDASIAETRLLVARDDDRDCAPDGDPVYVQVITDIVNPGNNAFLFLTQVLVDLDLLTDGFGRFLIGICIRTNADKTATTYAAATITLDSTRPTITTFCAGPSVMSADQQDHLVSKTTEQWVIVIETCDNGPHTVQIFLDPDELAASGNEIEVVNQTVDPGPHHFAFSPSAIPTGTYFYFYSISDGVGCPLTGYATNCAEHRRFRLGITGRMVGNFNFNWLDPDLPMYYRNGAGDSLGAILQGFNFNDLAGSSMCTVPDLNGDNLPELLIAARFGKPYVQSAHGVGFGEAYLFYGQTARMRDKLQLNAAGLQTSSYPSLAFPGIRAPKDETWTYGLADLAAIPDMDGDGYPELVFCFPRVESVPIALGKSADEMKIQSVTPDDVVGDASLEYNPYGYDIETGKYRWFPNEAQFTRGGIVIVSSHSYLLRYPDRLNRRGDRVLDLAEVGQIFDRQGAPPYVPYIWNAVDTPATAYCGSPPTATAYDNWTLYWDVVLYNQGPGGFDNAYTNAAFARLRFGSTSDFEPDPFQPPLANARALLGIVDLNAIAPPINDKCGTHCVVNNAWRTFGDCSLPSGGGFPGTWDAVCETQSWHASFEQAESGQAIWTGFYGLNDPTVACYGDAVGARILGQRREDRFGASVCADGTYLYISSPECQASSRVGSGAVYQLRTFARPGGSVQTQTQLWIEPRDLAGTFTPRWPYVDVEDATRRDWTMPVPHQYVIRTGGSTRGADVFVEDGASWPPPFGQPVSGSDRLVTYSFTGSGCTEAASQTVTGGMTADIVLPYPQGSPFWAKWGDGMAEYYIETSRQYVGPHPGAKLSAVRIVGDLNRDGTPDFGIGSPDVMTSYPSGCKAGAVFIVLERPTGVGGEIDLGRIALSPGHPQRLAGVMIRGLCDGGSFGRVFDAADDFNGDGIDDVLIGSQDFDGGRGQAVVLLGSTNLASPAGGWTIDQLIAEGHGIRFRGAAVGDLAGANVAGIGDMDGDGVDDILIAAPGASAGKGVVYLVYGSPSLTGQDVCLADAGGIDLPGVRFVGRVTGDALGGGRLIFDGDDPGADRRLFLNPGDSTEPYYRTVDVCSRGIARIGDVDGDGKADFAISAMLADPGGNTDAGEVYIIYGTGD